MAIAYQATHPEYQEMEYDYELLDDVMQGEYRIKQKGTKYLPMPNPTDRSADNLARYEQYKARAIFSNITRRIARSMIGLGFLREPEVRLPPELAMMEKDATGTGLSLVQLAKELGLFVLVMGRGGIHVDYPSRRLGIDPSRYRPYLVFYKAKEIVNWLIRGYRLQFVTLKREIEIVDGYNVTLTPRWRILEMVGGNNDNISAGGRYVNRLYHGTSPNPENVVPVDFNRRPFDHILFHICGAFSNSWSVDDAPMYPVATNNLGLFRNSADAEEIAYIGGQPQIFVSGLDNRVVQDSSNKDVYVGSRRGMLLGPNGRATMLQANPNSAPRELGLDKIELIQQLSMQLAVGGTNIQTATEIVTESLIRNSVLTSALQNVSTTITDALRDACAFVGANPDSVEFKIDTSIDQRVEMTEAMVSDAIRQGGELTQNSNSMEESA